MTRDPPLPLCGDDGDPRPTVLSNRGERRKDTDGPGKDGRRVLNPGPELQAGSE